MKTRPRILPHERWKSFKCAAMGLRDMLITEPNAWIHAAATIVVLWLAAWLHIGGVSFALIVLAVMSVWVAEAFNTVLEIMLDYVSGQKYSPIVRRAKDISASAVLIASIGAVIIGVSILGNPLLQKVKNIIG